MPTVRPAYAGTGTGRGGGGGRPRRAFLRGAFTLGVLGSTAAALAPVLRVRHRAPAVTAGPPAPPTATVDEMYRGRRIQVTVMSGGTPAGAAPDAFGDHPTGAAGARTVVAAGLPVTAPSQDDGMPDVLIDGRPLHVMRRADGTYLSAVDHYQSYPSPLDVARAAVDGLRGARLSMSGPLHHI